MRGPRDGHSIGDHTKGTGIHGHREDKRTRLTRRQRRSAPRQGRGRTNIIGRRIAPPCRLAHHALIGHTDGQRVRDADVLGEGRTVVRIDQRVGQCRTRYIGIRTAGFGDDEVRDAIDPGVPRRVALARRQLGDVRHPRDRIGVAVVGVTHRVLLGQGIANRRCKYHEVGSGHQIGEGVIARIAPDVIDGDGGADRSVVVASRLRYPVAVKILIEPHGDAVDAVLAGVLLAVAICIFPNVVAQGRRLVDAHVERQVLVPRLKEGRGIGVARSRIGVGICRVVAYVLSRYHIAWRQRVQIEGDGVSPRRQILKQVLPTGIRRIREDHTVHFIGLSRRRIVQRHHHPGNTALTTVLLTIGVVVIPDEVANAHRIVQPGVPGRIVLPRGQGRGDRLPRHWVRIAVHRVSHSILLGECVRIRRREHHVVVARDQIRERVGAARIRGGRGHLVPIPVVERNWDVLDPKLTAVLLAIAIQVLPHRVAQRGRLVHTGVPGGIVLAGLEGDGTRPPRRGIGIAVHGIIAALPLEGQGVPIRSGELDLVVAGVQIGKRVGAAGVRRRRGDLVAIVVVQRHQHVLNRWLAILLDPIAIQILPDVIAQRGVQRRRDLVAVGDALVGSQRSEVDKGRPRGGPGGDLHHHTHRARLAHVEDTQRPSDHVPALRAPRGAATVVGRVRRDSVRDHHTRRRHDAGVRHEDGVGHIVTLSHDVGLHRLGQGELRATRGDRGRIRDDIIVSLARHVARLTVVGAPGVVVQRPVGANVASHPRREGDEHGPVHVQLRHGPCRVVAREGRRRRVRDGERLRSHEIDARR